MTTLLPVTKGAALGATLSLVAAMTCWSAPRSGVYTNVCMHGETGDLGGVNIQFVADEPPAGVVWLCEGGCGWPMPMTSIQLKRDTIRFSVTEDDFDEKGMRVGSNTYHFEGQFIRSGLALTGDLPTFRRLILTRQKREQPTLARNPIAGRNEDSTPYPVRRCNSSGR